MSFRNRSYTSWAAHQRNRDGDITWVKGLGDIFVPSHLVDSFLAAGEAPFESNIVTDEGEDWVLYAAFQNDPAADKGGTFTSFELALVSNATLSETDTHSALTILTTNGATAKTINRNNTDWADPTGTTPASIALAASQVWTASGGQLGGATAEYVCLVTAGLTTEVLIAHAALNAGAGRVVADGETLTVTFAVNAGGS
jgi:hypothetical protein